jgi:hypothetical protein
LSRTALPTLRLGVSFLSSPAHQIFSAASQKSGEDIGNSFEQDAVGT